MFKTFKFVPLNIWKKVPTDVWFFQERKAVENPRQILASGLLVAHKSLADIAYTGVAHLRWVEKTTSCESWLGTSKI